MGFVPHLHYLKNKKEGESAHWQFIPGRTKQSTMRTAWREMHDDSLAPMGVPASPIWRLPKPHQRRVFMEISWCRCHCVSHWWLTQSPVPLPFPEDRGRGQKFQLSNDASVFLASSLPIKSHLGAPNHQSSRYYTKGTLITPQCQGFQEPYQKPGDQDQFISIIPQSPSLLSSQSYSFSSSHVRMREATKKAECRRIDAFKLWCWKRLLRVP